MALIHHDSGRGQSYRFAFIYASNIRPGKTPSIALCGSEMPRPSPRRDYQTVRFPPFDFASAVMPSIGAKPFSASVARFCPRCCTSSALGCLRAPRRATRDVTPGRARLGAGRSEPNATSLRKPIAAAVTPLGAGSRPNENRIRYAAKSTVWHHSASLDASSRRMPKRNPRSRSAIASECRA